MGLVPDEGVIQELAAASPDPAFGDRVHPGRPRVAEHSPDPGADEDGVERGGEVRTAIADHELELICLVAEVHDQVACLLGGPSPVLQSRFVIQRLADHGLLGATVNGRTATWMIMLCENPLRACSARSSPKHRQAV